MARKKKEGADASKDDAKPAQRQDPQRDSGTEVRRVVVEFNKNYIASRGPGIAGSKGRKYHFRMTPELQALIDDGTCSLVKEVAAERRETATGKRNAEKS